MSETRETRSEERRRGRRNLLLGLAVLIFVLLTAWMGVQGRQADMAAGRGDLNAGVPAGR